MRRLCILLAALVCLSAGWSAPAAAHELKSDNGISAVLHIVPDDNPRSEEETTLYFSFDSQNRGFDLNYCKCQVSFQSSENKLVSAPVTPDAGSSTGGYATVTFPRAGVYTVALRGLVASEPGSYFNLKYTLRVAAGTTAAQAAMRRTASGQVILLTLTGLVILAIVAAEFIRRGKRYTIKR